MNSNQLARPLAWSIAALSIALALAGLLVNLLARIRMPGQGWLDVHRLFSPATTVSYAVVGALVASRQPRNPIGWIFGVVGVFAGLTGLASGYPTLGQTSAARLPWIDLARWFNLWAWIPVTMLPLTFVLLLFPDGRFLSWRWRLVGWIAGLGTAACHARHRTAPAPADRTDAAAQPVRHPGRRTDAGAVVDGRLRLPADRQHRRPGGR